VTNARATGDYFHADHQWAIGQTALFYDALGILPFKDGFYSSSDKQIGGQTVGPEESPDREALMAVLSTAMVAPMDGINLLNKTRVMQTCRLDGTVLRPDRPLTPVDWCFLSAGGDDPMCFLYSSHSDVEGSGRHFYLYSDAPRALEPAMLALGDNAKHILLNWYNNGEMSLFVPNASLTPGPEGHVYGLVAPVLPSGQWAFLGELNKFASASRLRFMSAVESGQGSGSMLSVKVMGSAGETVRVCAANCAPGGWAMVCETATFQQAGEQVFVLLATGEAC